MCYFHLLCFTSPNPLYGLPWWLSGKEATCQCRRRGFHSGLGKSHKGKGNPLRHPSPNEMSDTDTTITSLSRVTQGGEDVMTQVSVVHGSSPVWLFSTPWTEAHQASLSFSISRSLVRLMSIESVMASTHLFLHHLLLLLPSVFPGIRQHWTRWLLKLFSETLTVEDTQEQSSGNNEESFFKSIYLSCSIWTLSCSMQGLFSWPGIKPGLPALGVQSLATGHWEMP